VFAGRAKLELGARGEAMAVEPVPEIQVHAGLLSFPPAELSPLDRCPVEQERAFTRDHRLDRLEEYGLPRVVRADDEVHSREPLDPQLLEAAEVLDLDRCDHAGTYPTGNVWSVR
jgi:hypothetical protein